MDAWLIVVALILAGTFYFSILRGERSLLLYIRPQSWMLKLVERWYERMDWKLVGDVALGVLFGLPALRMSKRSALYLLFLPLFLSAPIYAIFGLTGVALYYVGASAFGILETYAQGGTPLPGVAPLLPGVRIGPFYVPLVEGVVALFVALLVHEGAHGCVALSEGIPVRRAGILLLGFLPIGAFVEPDERVLSRKDARQRAKVYAAGPFANIATALLFSLFLLILSPLSTLLTDYVCAHGDGVLVISVEENAPAQGVLEVNDVILFVDGNRIHCPEELLNVMKPIRDKEANGMVEIVVLRNGKRVTLNVPYRNGRFGIKVGPHVPSYPLWYMFLSFLFSLLGWISLINVLVGVVNALPLPLLDGGEALRGLLPERAWRILVYATLILLLINVLPWAIK